MLTESREEFSDLHSIFKLCALRYSENTHDTRAEKGPARHVYGTRI